MTFYIAACIDSYGIIIRHFIPLISIKWN